MKGRISAVVLALCLVLSMLPVSVRATVVMSGTCGPNLTWTLDDNGTMGSVRGCTLTIQGTGEMTNYTSKKNVPWYGFDNSNYPIGSVKIESGVTSIGDYAFSGCSGLTSMTIPSSVTSIGKYAFSECSYLKSVTMTAPSSLTSIGSSAFSGCRALTGVVIPNGVTNIGNSAFYACSSLTSMDIPGSVTSIGNSAFYGCGGLTSVTIPSSVTSIGKHAFFKCSCLTDIQVDSGNSNYISQDGVLFTKDMNTLVVYPGGKSGSYDIPADVTSIEDGAFSYCGGLTDIQVANGNSNYISQDGVLFTKDKMTLVAYPGGKSGGYDIPAGVTSIGGYAFCGCGGLTSVNVPDSVTSIEGSAFSNCSSLKDVYYEGSRQQWWNEVRTAGDNEPLRDADIHYGKYDIEVRATPVGSGTVNGGGVYLPDAPVTVTAQANSGYVFEKWTENGALISMDTEHTFTAAKDQTFVAVFIKDTSPTCTVTFDSQGGSAVSPSTVTSGSAVTKPADPTHSSGDIFGGWYKEAACENMWDFAADLVNGDITLYAKWIRRYTVTFDPQGGRVTPASAMTDGSGRLSTLPTPDYDVCHSFGGWRTGDGVAVDTDTVFDQDTTIFASWAVAHTELDIPAVPATCTTSGKTAGKKCSVCGDILKAQSEIPAPGHTPVNLPDKAPTCGEAGFTGGIQCSVCKIELKAPTEVPATGIHTPGTVKREDIQTPATCTAEGLKIVTYECSVCLREFEKKEIISTTDHTQVDLPGKAATCTKTGLTEGAKCSVCGTILKEQEEIPVTDHSWGPESVTETKAPTCTETGSKTITRICTVCSKIETQTEDIEVLEHSEVEIPAVPATCDTDGSTAGKECSVCHEILEQPQVIPAAHTSVKIIPGEAAACTEKGWTDGEECAACKQIITPREEIPALGHAWVSDGTGVETISKQPTCTEAGEKTVTGGSKCSRCQLENPDPVTVTIPAKGHTWGEPVETIAKAPTCAEKGSKTLTVSCTVSGCDGKKEAVEELDRLPHSWGEWNITKEATATESGTKERECSVCHEKETETIPASGSPVTPDDSKTFTVTFNANGGSGDAVLTTGTDGKLARWPADPARSGYAFAGWYTAVSGGAKVEPGSIFSGNTTLYAHWTADAAPETRYWVYTPSSTPGGSFKVSHSSAPQGARVTIELSPRSGYELDRLSVTNLDTYQEQRLTRRSSEAYTFTMPAADVEVEIAFTGRYTGNTDYTPAYTPVSPQAGRTNLAPWYYSNGYIYHIIDGLVPVGSLLTRDMLISVLYNMDGTSTGEPEFWATNNAVVPNIYESWLWGVDMPISREQVAMILFGYAKHKNYNTSQSVSLTGYADYGQIRPIARSAMSWTRAAGLMTGTTATTLSPRGNLTCGQANTILSRFVANVAWMR